MAKRVKDRTHAEPVRELRKQVTELEAALALVTAGARKKPVHTVRTATRRIEAQLELLGMLAGENSAVKSGLGESAKVRKLLGAVRKAAGKVRDLDVQEEMVRRAVAKDAAGGLKDEAVELGEHLKSRRTRAVKVLLTTLKGHVRRLAPRLEEMMQLLEPAADLTVADASLVELTKSWYEAGVKAAGEGDTAERLHRIRKRAKLARYIAEGDGDSAAAVAAKLEDLQQSGGRWHDAMTLRSLAKRRLGKKAALVELFHEREKHALAEYEQKMLQRG